MQYRLVSPASARAPAETIQSLPAQPLVIMLTSASAFRWRQFTVRPPRKQPRLHVLMRNVMSRFNLPVRLADFPQHSFLVRHVRLNRIRNKKVRTPPGNLGQLSQPLLNLRLQPNAKRRTPCVRHEHIIPRRRFKECSPQKHESPDSQSGLSQERYRTLSLKHLQHNPYDSAVKQIRGRRVTGGE